MHDFPNLWAFLFFKMNLVMYGLRYTCEWCDTVTTGSNGVSSQRMLAI